MIYIDDCIDATVRYLKADPARLKRHVYNLAGIPVTTGDLCSAVQRLIPGLKVDYVPDFRQQIADSWPDSIDDSDSLRDWDWSYNISTFEMANKIFNGIDEKYKISLKNCKIKIRSSNLTNERYKYKSRN